MAKAPSKGSDRSSWYKGNAKGRGDGKDAKAPESIHARHARERQDTHVRHSSERDDMHKRHQKDHEALAARHEDELMAELGAAGAAAQNPAAAPPVAGTGAPVAGALPAAAA